MSFRSALQLQKDSSEGDYLENDTSTGLGKRQGISLIRRNRIELAAEHLPVFYPKGGMFFLEGATATGVFLLHSGRVKESMVSSMGKTAIVRVVGPGAILGLSAVLTGSPHESTAEPLEPSHADFIRKGHFLHLLKTSRGLNQLVASQLLSNQNEANATIRCLAVSSSVSERLARLLLHWAECPTANQDHRTAKVRIQVPLTHEEIGQSIGSTRETMSRLLGEFRKKKWITMNGRIWTITNGPAIRRLAAV